MFNTAFEGYRHQPPTATPPTAYWNTYAQIRFRRSQADHHPTLRTFIYQLRATLTATTVIAPRAIMPQSAGRDWQRRYVSEQGSRTICSRVEKSVPSSDGEDRPCGEKHLLDMQLRVWSPCFNNRHISAGSLSQSREGTDESTWATSVLVLSSKQSMSNRMLPRQRSSTKCELTAIGSPWMEHPSRFNHAIIRC